MLSILDLKKQYASRIAPLDLELLFSFALKKPREFVLAHPEYKITSHQSSVIENNIKRRINGEPIAYILGKKEFYGLDFKVNQNTLIPRPETELLVELALEEIHTLLRNLLRNINIIDVGTGSGNIIISIARQLKNQELGTLPTGRQVKNYAFYGIDISEKALGVAKQNAKVHKLDKKIKFIKGNLLEPILKDKKCITNPTRYILLANLPYLDAGWKNLLKSTETKGLKYEPSIALYAGKDGLDAYRELAKQLQILHSKNNSPITIFCEIGHIQKQEMRKIFSFAKTTFFKDLSDKWRVCKIEIQS